MVSTKGRAFLVLSLIWFGWAGTTALGQPLGQPDRDAPGDERIQAYLSQEAARLESIFQEDLAFDGDLAARRREWKQQYLDMLGIWPLPEKTALRATMTGRFEGDGFVVENLHYQSMPGLYVTANLYRPTKPSASNNRGRLPAILYVCGHSGRGRNGNKTAFQSHGIWFARHGYVCLVVDTLQLGEIAATHHGTYNLQRWWWHSRGYTPAGVECWNGVRGVDYLISRDDVDPERIAVTGISGGGAATIWIAAADERIQAAAPVSGMADLTSYVSNRVINGHCDCMFLYNTYRWPWPRIAALIAPRPLLFVNSDQDPIFPMDANDRIANRLERVYSRYGAGEFVDAQVSVGGHDYRADIRRGVYRFMNLALRNDDSPILDSERDLETGKGDTLRQPIPAEKLRVFPTDADLPQDQRNTAIDQSFVPLASNEIPESDRFAEWKADRLRQLRTLSFGYFPPSVPAAVACDEPLNDKNRAARYSTESPLRVSCQLLAGSLDNARRVVLLVSEQRLEEVPSELRELDPGTAVVAMQPRGLGDERWTTRNPPNYVERSHLLLGRTVDTGRVWDVIAVARSLSKMAGGAGKSVDRPVRLQGRGNAAVWCLYAGLLENSIESVTPVDPPRSHADPKAPQFLNVLRIVDIPQAMRLLDDRLNR
ncbi:MAG: hypothetical protein FJ295_15840 [Planctomycetes bacterium]|nr:hypothetical protein [Planctomycetota bacterium]